MEEVEEPTKASISWRTLTPMASIRCSSDIVVTGVSSSDGVGVESLRAECAPRELLEALVKGRMPWHRLVARVSHISHDYSA